MQKATNNHNRLKSKLNTSSFVALTTIDLTQQKRKCSVLIYFSRENRRGFAQHASALIPFPPRFLLLIIWYYDDEMRRRKKRRRKISVGINGTKNRGSEVMADGVFAQKKWEIFIDFVSKRRRETLKRRETESRREIRKERKKGRERWTKKKKKRKRKERGSGCVPLGRRATVSRRRGRGCSRAMIIRRRLH